MEVRELQDKLSKLPADAQVHIYYEDGHQFFGIDDVSLDAGTPSRDAAGKPHFRFESSGLVKWVFITISPD